MIRTKLKKGRLREIYTSYYKIYNSISRLKVMGILNPLNIFLRQEIDRMQKVIKLVRVTLRDLLLAIEGTIIMNEVC